MFTQVGFGEFLDPFLQRAKVEHSIEFQESPNVPIHWEKGDWLYAVENGFDVRIFRWLEHEKPEIGISGPYSKNETLEQFAKRFAEEFWAGIERLKD